MRQRIRGRIAFVCDECQDTLQTDDDDLEAATRFMNEQGWRNIAKERLPHHIILRVDHLNAGKFANICYNCLDNME